MNPTEKEFRDTGAAMTQVERLADYLRARPGIWVAMPELARVITPTGIGAAVHSRIADCRRLGMPIDQRQERVKGTHAIASFYRFSPGENSSN